MFLPLFIDFAMILNFAMIYYNFAINKITKLQ